MLDKSAAQTMTATDKARLFGMDYASERAVDLLDIISTGPTPNQGVRLIVTTNVDHIVQLRKNQALRSAYDRAWRRTIDGMPVYLYAKLRRRAVPERVTGADFVAPLVNRLAPTRHRLFFVCNSDTVAQHMQNWATELGFPEGAVVTVVPPFGFEKDAAYSESLAAQIRDHRTTHLLFSLGCPKSEIWIDRHADQLGDLYALPVGASLAFLTGEVRRAPRFMRDFGLEWLWRVGQEPRRLAGRYFVSSWGFWLAILNDIRDKPL